jgi:hypothetical protein
LLEATFLNEIQKRGKHGEEESGVGGKKKSYMEKDPAGVEEGEGGAFLAGMEGWNQAEEKADGQKEDAKGDGAVADVDEEKGQRQEEAKEGLRFVGIDGKTMVGLVEHLGQRYEVEEYSGYGGRDSYVTPAGAVIESCGQDRERGDAVERDRDSEPEEGHK